MAKYKIVHYLNQFFGGIGGEDKADFQPEVREEIIGPGMALNDGLGDDYEIVATVICGDNYFGENLDNTVLNSFVTNLFVVLGLSPPVIIAVFILYLSLN